MNLKPLSPDFSVTPQIEAADIAELAVRGFKSIIGNRPEGEAPDQPSWPSLVAQAERHGMSARQIPVVPGQIGPDDVRRFAEALRDLPTPIAAFCRTGTRSTILWALANEARLTANERIKIAAKEGYDLEPFRGLLEGANTSPPSKTA